MRRAMRPKTNNSSSRFLIMSRNDEPEASVLFVCNILDGYRSVESRDEEHSLSDFQCVDRLESMIKLDLNY